MVFISLLSGMLVKLVLNVPFIVGFNTMGLPAFYGAITTTILGFLVSSIISMAFLRKKYKINFETTVKEMLNIIFAVLVMAIVLYGLKILLPFVNLGRFKSILIVCIYATLGAIIFLFITYKTKTIENVFGKEEVNDLINKIFKKRGNKNAKASKRRK